MATRRGPDAARDEAEEEGEPVGEEGSVARLLRGILAESSRLVRQEVELARAELNEKLDLVVRYATAMALGAALLVCAFFFLLSALDRGFTSALALLVDARVAVWLAPLLLAALLGGIGVWLLASARRTLRAERLVPEKTVESLRENTTWIKERLR